MMVRQFCVIVIVFIVDVHSLRMNFLPRVFRPGECPVKTTGLSKPECHLMVCNAFASTAYVNIYNPQAKLLGKLKYMKCNTYDTCIQNGDIFTFKVSDESSSMDNFTIHGLEEDHGAFLIVVKSTDAADAKG